MGLYDRDYMKDEPGSRPPRPTWWGALAFALLLAGVLAWFIRYR